MDLEVVLGAAKAAQLEAFGEAIHFEFDACWQALLINLLGAAIESLFIAKGPVKWKSVAIIGGYGLFVWGPFGNLYFHLMQYYTEYFGWNFITMMVVDQLVAGSFWNTIFLHWLAFCELRLPPFLTEPITTLKTVFQMTTSSIIYWGPVQCVNYTIIPEPQRLLFCSLAGIPWNIYLTIVAKNEAKKKAELEKKKKE